MLFNACIVVVVLYLYRPKFTRRHQIPILIVNEEDDRETQPLFCERAAKSLLLLKRPTDGYELRSRVVFGGTTAFFCQADRKRTEIDITANWDRGPSMAVLHTHTRARTYVTNVFLLSSQHSLSLIHI